MRAAAIFVAAALTSPALALDLNSFRAQHGRPPLSHSSTLAGIAQEHASSMASRKRLDHANFRQRTRLIGTGVGTVRKWELGTRRPSGAARTLIEVIKREPKAVRRALARKAS
jgi:hypothetical protein